MIQGNQRTKTGRVAADADPAAETASRPRAPAVSAARPAATPTASAVRPAAPVRLERKAPTDPNPSALAMRLSRRGFRKSDCPASKVASPPASSRFWVT